MNLYETPQPLLGAALRGLRQQFGISVLDLVDGSEIRSPQTIYDIEQGRTLKPRLSTLKYLAAQLKFDDAEYAQALEKTKRILRAKGIALSANAEPTLEKISPSECAVETTLNFFPQTTDRGFTCRPIYSTQELRDLWEIDSAAYSEIGFGIEYSLFEEWWCHFPEGLTALFHDDKVAGAIGLWPVPAKWIRKFIPGQRREQDLRGRAISTAWRKYSPHWYNSGIVLEPSFRKPLAIVHLVRGTAAAFQKLIADRKTVDLWAMALHPRIERLLSQRFGFRVYRGRTMTKHECPIYHRTVTSDDCDQIANLFPKISPIETE